MISYQGLVRTFPRGYVSRLPDADSRQSRSNISAGRIAGNRAVPVTVTSVDLSQEDQIFLEVNDKQQAYRLRLHSTSQTVKDQIDGLLLNPSVHDAHLVKRAEHSYQLHIDGRFVVMASSEDLLAIPTHRRSAEISKTHDDTIHTGSSTKMVLPECIQEKSYLEHHGLGAALLDAVKKVKKQ